MSAEFQNMSAQFQNISYVQCFILHYHPSFVGFTGPVLPHISLTETCGNIEKHCPTLPNWVKGAAKLLNNGDESRDWQSLAKELGK